MKNLLSLSEQSQQNVAGANHFGKKGLKQLEIHNFAPFCFRAGRNVRLSLVSPLIFVEYWQIQAEWKSIFWNGIQWYSNLWTALMELKYAQPHPLPPSLPSPLPTTPPSHRPPHPPWALVTGPEKNNWANTAGRPWMIWRWPLLVHWNCNLPPHLGKWTFWHQVKPNPVTILQKQYCPARAILLDTPKPRKPQQTNKIGP